MEGISLMKLQWPVRPMAPDFTPQPVLTTAWARQPRMKTRGCYKLVYWRPDATPAHIIKADKVNLDMGMMKGVRGPILQCVVKRFDNLAWLAEETYQAPGDRRFSHWGLNAVLMPFFLPIPFYCEPMANCLAWEGIVCRLCCLVECMCKQHDLNLYEPIRDTMI